MQTTYNITCKCGHDFPIPAQFLSTDEDERTALLKALEGLTCPDCIRNAIDHVHALREHLLKTGTVPPDITEEAWKSLARDARRDILRENIIPPMPPRSPDISHEIMRYPEPLDITDFRGEPYPLLTARERTLLSVIDSWNRHHPVGTEVLIKPTDAEKVSDPHTHRTTSPAMLLAGKPVVEVSDLGPVDLDRVLYFEA